MAGYSLFIGSQRVRHDWATKHSPAQKGAAGSRHTMVGSLSPPGATVCNVSFTLGNNCEALEFRQRLHQQGHVVLVQRVFVPKGKRSPQSLDLGPGDKRLTVAALGPGPRSVTRHKGRQEKSHSGLEHSTQASHVTFNSDQREVPKSGQKPKVTAGG